MPASPSTLIFFVGITVYIGVRTAFKLRLPATEKSVDKATPADRSLVALVGLSQIALPLLFALSSILDGADYPVSAVLPWLGTLLMAAGVWLFWRSHVDLGKNWSVTLELARDHRLVTHGVYRSIRHPMYAAFFLMALAQAALLPNWIAGGSALVAVSLLYGVRKRSEEAMMLDHFGQAYRAYMRRSGGVLPRFPGWSKP